jgi:hypothetical protein
MSDPAPKRQPAGIPIGGQFAPKSTAEAELDLLDDDLIDAAGEHDRAGLCAGQPDHEDLTDVLTASRAWVDAGVTNPADMRRLADCGVTPRHFVDPDRNIRMWACAARGDLIFEGELLSNALQLHRHAPGLDPRRHFHPEATVYVDGEERSWCVLLPEEQLDYIRGYAQASASHADPTMQPPGREPFKAAGWLRARDAIAVAGLIDSGLDADRSYAIVDPDAVGRWLVVRNVRPARAWGGYRGEVAAGQRRYHPGEDYSRAVPWTEGTRVFFTVDALGAA